MGSDLRGRWARFVDAMAECRRAEIQWEQLRNELAVDTSLALSGKEARHLTHTVFRINALLFLYSRLRGAEHNTRLGVVLGAITHLLDYVYDHDADSVEHAARFEDLIRLRAAPTDGNPLALALAQLSGEVWRTVADPDLFAARLAVMLETQRASMAQSNGRLSHQALHELSQEKGHQSLCLYFAAVNARFDEQEAAALRTFGLYMQYMDDLEDYYEDRAEARQSPIESPLAGVWRTSRLLLAAHVDLRRHYRATSPGGYRIFTAWVRVFHAGIVLACTTRELTRRLPRRTQVWIDRRAEQLAERNPFFRVAPIGLTHYPIGPATDRRSRTRRALSIVSTVLMASWAMWRRSRDHAAAFATVVDPIVVAAIADPDERGRVRRPLLEWALKGGYMVDAYSRLAGIAAPDALGVLCGAAGRLYDDLLESGTRPDLGKRLTDLFMNGEFEPADDLERLLFALHREIGQRLGRPPGDPVFRALQELHQYQLRSARQRDPALDNAALNDITFQKGALTVELLYTLARPAMTAREREIVQAVGGALQLVDDYQDVWWDRRAGFTTRATRSEIHWRGLWRHLSELERLLASYYEPRRAARFADEARLQLLVAWFASRRRPTRAAGATPQPERDPPPLQLLFRRGSNVPVSAVTAREHDAMPCSERLAGALPAHAPSAVQPPEVAR